MLNKLLNAVDDFIIDRLAQPVTDLVRRLTGFSKRIPCSATLLLCAMSFIPISIEMVGSGIPGAVVMGLFNIFIALIAAYASFVFISLELHEREESAHTSAIDDERIRGKAPRLGVLFTGILLVVCGFALHRISPRYDWVFPIILGQLSLISFLYFKACTDLPRGKTAFTKLKEILEKFFLSPALVR